MTTKPLQYEISNWSQVSKCRSNNSDNLYLTLSRFVQNNAIQGDIIKVQHKLFGTLFAAPIKCDGAIISDTDRNGDYISFMSTDSILKELERFGFRIVFEEPIHLSGKQLEYLSTIMSLGYDKLNVLRVRSISGNYETKVVALNSNSADRLLIYGAKMSKASLATYVSESMVYVFPDEIIAQFPWSWLTYICNIQDILTENSKVRGIDLDLNGTPDMEEAKSNLPLFEPADDEGGHDEDEDI